MTIDNNKKERITFTKYMNSTGHCEKQDEIRQNRTVQDRTKQIQDKTAQIKALVNNKNMFNRQYKRNKTIYNTNKKISEQYENVQLTIQTTQYNTNQGTGESYETCTNGTKQYSTVQTQTKMS